MTGNTVTTSTSAPRPPKRIVMPTGFHMAEPAAIIGTTPTAVVTVVRKMGTIRRLPASNAASRADSPFFIPPSACSKMRISLRIISPISVMNPKMVVSPIVVSVMKRPNMALGMNSMTANMQTNVSLYFLKLNSRKKKMIIMAMNSPAPSCGMLRVVYRFNILGGKNNLKAEKKDHNEWDGDWGGDFGDWGM